MPRGTNRKLDEKVGKLLYSEADGPEQALTTDEIADKVGEPRTRENSGIRSAIRRLRHDGHPILATTGRKHGYFVPTSPEDVARWLESMDRRIAQMVTTRNAVASRLAV